MKKALSLIVVLSLSLLCVSPAAACGGHRKNAVSYAVCPTESCVETGLHSHGRTIYAAHSYDDGHKYHLYCELEDCPIAEYHEHDGVYCFGHSYDDGHDYHDYCGIARCTIEEYHAHNGVYCFGHTKDDGHSYHKSGRGHHHG